MRIIFMIIMTVLVTSCGFKPMYGQFSDNPQLQEQMKTVRVDYITEHGRPSRIGQVFRNNLLDRFAAFGQAERTDYVLKVSFIITEEGYGIRQDESVTLNNIRLVADFSLETADKSETVFNSSARSIVSYDLVQSDFSNMSARNASLLRMTNDISQQITTQIGAYLNRQKDA